MEKRYIIGIDQSTQGTKALLFDGEGHLLRRTDLPHRQIVNEKGWVSHDLNEIYRNTVQTVKTLVAESGVAPEEIAGIGISNQRETTAIWDKATGEPLEEAIVWQCGRASGIAQEIAEQRLLLYRGPGCGSIFLLVRNRLYADTGQPADAGQDFHSGVFEASACRSDHRPGDVDCGITGRPAAADGNGDGRWRRR